MFGSRYLELADGINVHRVYRFVLAHAAMTFEWVAQGESQ